MKLKVLGLAAAVLLGLGLATAAPAEAATHRPTIGISATRHAVNLGARVTIAGKVSPNLHGRYVTLQRYYDGGWRTEKAKKLSAGSRYTLVVEPSRAGVWTLRVHYFAQSGWGAANSKSVSIKVTRKAPVAAPVVGCHPLTNGGGCYEPGEFCRSTDHGVRGVAGNGEAIECEDDNGWRWEPA